MVPTFYRLGFKDNGSHGNAGPAKNFANGRFQVSYLLKETKFKANLRGLLFIDIQHERLF